MVVPHGPRLVPVVDDTVHLYLIPVTVRDRQQIALEKQARRVIRERQRCHLALRERGVGANLRIDRQAKRSRELLRGRCRWLVAWDGKLMHCTHDASLVSLCASSSLHVSVTNGGISFLPKILVSCCLRTRSRPLVIETTNFSNLVPSFNTGLLEALGTGTTAHLTERFTRIDFDTLRYEFTVTDPDTFTQPFSGVLQIQRGDVPVFEYACHEGNYGMINLLSGARQQELVERAAR